MLTYFSLFSFDGQLVSIAKDRKETFKISCQSHTNFFFLFAILRRTYKKPNNVITQWQWTRIFLRKQTSSNSNRLILTLEKSINK